MARKVGSRPVRILVIDTDGINVWCSAGKGRFSAEEILDKARRFGLLDGPMPMPLILPKFSLSGVKLATLRRAGVRPVIGPFYASDLPDYLDSPKLKDRDEDRIRFDLSSRLLSSVPTAVHFLFLTGPVYFVAMGHLTSLVVWWSVGFAFTYPILFPMLPTRLFAIKGMVLGGICCVAPAYLAFHGLSPWMSLFWCTYMLATAGFIGLSYTGNSAVSSASRVRKEIAHFLPVVVVLFGMALTAIICQWLGVTP